VERKLGGQHANDARIVSRPPDRGLAEAAQPRALMRRLTSHRQEQSGRCELSLPELNGLGAACFLPGVRRGAPRSARRAACRPRTAHEYRGM
jgi:hypothetical protein